MPRIQFSHVVFLLLTLVVILVGCSGLGGEPRIIVTFAPPTPQTTFPVTNPDVALGARLFAENCTQCHGMSGAGDGILIGDGPNQVATQPLSFLDPATRSEQTPYDWYSTITNGRIEKLMPPWQDALTSDERWAVAMYTYNLSISLADTQNGEKLLELANLAPNDVSVDEWANSTDRELLEKSLPSAFIDGLNETQRFEVAAYLRTRHLSSSESVSAPIPQPATTDEPTVSVVPEVGTISGFVTNNTSGGVLAADLVAQLFVLDQQGADEPIEGAIGDDGRFLFENVPILPGRGYLVTVEHQSRVFGSEIRTFDTGSTNLELSVQVFDVTDDASVISILGWVAQIEVLENRIEIRQAIQISNTSDRAYSTTVPVGDERFESVRISLPPGAQALSISDSPRYILSEVGDAIIDTQPVLPGDGHIFSIAYTLLYSGSTSIRQPIDYAFDGPFRLLVYPEDAKITSEEFLSLGPQTLSGETFQSYGTTVSKRPQEALEIRLEGGQLIGNTAFTGNSILPIVLFTVGLIAIVVSGILYWRGGRTAHVEVDQQLIDSLVRQIAELDEDYAAGKFSEKVYAKSRERLKKRLADLVGE